MSRQTRDGAGLGIDAAGGPVIDPTQNVLQLVDAAIGRQDDLRAAEAKYQDGMRAAETYRINRESELRQRYEERIARMLQTSVESTSALVSQQLVQIQSTFNERVSKLEQFRWESGGKTSVIAALAVVAALLISACGIVVTIMLK
jgi:hypothetical protein